MSAHDPVNILLVDDQPAKLLSYEVTLAELGENLIKANSAREALELILKNEVAVILVDVCMPELDGFELASMLREHPRYEKTAIIFISAVHLSDFDRVRGYETGAVDYVPVPVVPEILRRSGAWFSSIGRPNNVGTKLFMVSGHVNKPATFEEALGESFKDIIEKHCGGIRGGWDNLLAVIPGGASCPVVKGEDMMDAIMDFDGMREAVALVDGRAKLEASGGIRLDTIRPIAETGVDYISTSKITQSAPAVDIGLDEA